MEAFSTTTRLIPRPIGLREEADPNVGRYLPARAQYVAVFSRVFARRGAPEAVPGSDLPTGVDELKQRLADRPPERPAEVSVRGTFAPALLLFAGWWERAAAAAPEWDANWKDGLQEWLFTGFEQWGPSWDLSYASFGGRSDADLVGQLAAGDESNSIAVIVAGDHARAARAELERRGGFFEAELTGVLAHRTHVPELAGRAGEALGADFDHCLVVSGERHRVAPLSRAPGLYSAYLWQCLAPKAWLRPGLPPRLDEVYFVWEHTDLTKPDAVRYAVDALAGKRDYLEAARGELELLQKSGGAVPGEPVWPVEVFHRFLLEDAGGA